MKGKSLKIVIPFWGFSKSGGCRVLSELATRFEEIGHEVTIICPEHSIEPYYPVGCKVIFIDKNGNETRRNKNRGLQNALSTICDIFIRYKSLVKGIEKYCRDYDIVLANQAETAYVAYRCCVQNKYYYIQAYEAWENTEKRNILRRLFNYFVKKTYALPVTKIVNADIYKNYKEIVSDYVVPPGLDLNLYCPKENKSWDGVRPLVVGCIGRIETWKGSQDVADAIEILRSRGINVHFRVAFNPVDCSDYELVKPDGDKNLANYYRNLDILVAPAKLQLGAIHYPVIEAMASGTTVITTGYYPANDSNSYIVPVSAPVVIADTIEHIAQNYDEAKQKASEALNEIQRFDWEAVSDSMLNIFRDTMIGGNLK